MNPPDHNFVSLFATRFDLWRALRELSEEQLRQVSKEEIEEFRTVQDIRSAVLLRLEQWERTHNDILQDWNNIESRLEPEIRNECNRIRRLTDSAVQESQRFDLECSRHLTEQRNATLRELTAISQGSHTLHAYQNSDTSSSRLAFDTNQ